MRFLRFIAILLLTMGYLHSAGSLSACPLCKEAIASPGTDDEEEINTAPAAYNHSIYLMVGVPYFLLGSVGYFIYRGCQKNALYLGQSQLPGVGNPETPGQSPLPPFTDR